MTTRQLLRLIIFTITCAATAALLFSGPTTSAAKGDRSAPTTPANLIVTAVTETTVNLSWQGSTDNSGKLSYKVKINNLNNSSYNSLATVTQTQTTYTAKYLATNSNYTFAVYAVDDSGNKSADSNLASAHTLADTTPPSGPVLQSTVLSPSEVQLTWTKATDNVSNSCCNYNINVNGARVGWTESSDNSDSQEKIEYEIYVNGVISPLPVSAGIDFDFVYGTAFGDNYFTIKAVDSSGNSSAPSVPIKLFLWPC